MSTITKNYTFTDGATIQASEHNANFDTIYNDYNGNITNANIASNAGIADSKLAQITTASKVSGAALTALASTPSGAGTFPAVNLGSGTANTNTYLRGDLSWNAVTPKVYTSYFQREMDASSGDVSYTASNFTPIAVFFFACAAGGMSNGSSDGTRHTCNTAYTGNNYANDLSHCISLVQDVGATKSQSAIVKTFDSGGFTLTWTRTGTTAGATASINFIVFG